MGSPDSKMRSVRWLLVVAYGIGSPIFAILEAMRGAFSARFDYLPEFLYFVSLVQFSCAVFLAAGRLRLISLAGLTVMSLGAIYSHFKIGSPLTALPSTVFTIIQIWYGYQLWRNQNTSR